MYRGLPAHRQNTPGCSLVGSQTDNFTGVHPAAFIGSTICPSRVRAGGEHKRPLYLRSNGREEQREKGNVQGSGYCWAQAHSLRGGSAVRTRKGLAIRTRTSR